MSASQIREKLAGYLQVADEEKIKALYIMLEDEINTPLNDWDDDFTKELERRSKSFADGTAKTYSWEETREAARKRLKSKKK